MTKRDLAWRAAGGALIVLGCAPGMMMPPGGAGLWSAAAILGACVAVIGVVLAVNGRRVGVALRIERSRHRELPLIIHARRCSRPTHESDIGRHRPGPDGR